MQVILDNALTATAAYWPSLMLFFTWLGRADPGQSRPGAGRARPGAVSGPAGVVRRRTTHPGGGGIARLGFPLPGDHPALLDRVIPLRRGRRLTAHPQRPGAFVQQVTSPRAPHHRTQGRHPQPDHPRFGAGALRSPQRAAATHTAPTRSLSDYRAEIRLGYSNRVRAWNEGDAS
jgi:hypothetical protein